MSLFNKMLASVGIGTATVDTHLETTSVQPGGVLRGETFIRGGKVEQQVQDVYLDVTITYMSDDSGRASHSLIHYRLSSVFALQPREERVIPFQVPVPWQTPLSVMGFPVGLRTGLDVTGIDPKDMDALNVLPIPVQRQVLDACGQLGLQMFKVDCKRSHRYGNGTPFVQEFEFRPYGGPFAGRVNEVEIMFNLDPNEVRVLVNVDRRAVGFTGFLDEMTGMDERVIIVRLPHDATGVNLSQVLGDAISRGLQRRH